MLTKREFLGSALAVAGLLPKIGRGVASKDVAWRDLAEVHMLKGGGRVYALANRGELSSSAVFVSPTGRVAVVDGGDLADGPFLASLLRNLGGTVDYWFLTHAHGDHYGALLAILEGSASDRPAINELVFDFPAEDWLAAAEPAGKEKYRRLSTVLAGAGASIRRGRNAVGCVRDLGGGWTFETLNRAFLAKGNRINNSSVCFRVEAGGKTWLVTGDIADEGFAPIVATNPEKIKTDVVFMAHHGQGGLGKRHYEAISPKICIWPTPDWLWENRAFWKKGTVLSADFETDLTKCWMRELKIREHYVCTHDWCFR